MPCWRLRARRLRAGRLRGWRGEAAQGCGPRGWVADGTPLAGRSDRAGARAPPYPRVPFARLYDDGDGLCDGPAIAGSCRDQDGFTRHPCRQESQGHHDWQVRRAGCAAPAADGLPAWPPPTGSTSRRPAFLSLCGKTLLDNTFLSDFFSHLRRLALFWHSSDGGFIIGMILS